MTSTHPQYMSYRAHGLARTLKQLLTLSQPRVGTLVGVDANGNEYYENRKDINFRDRWVLYAKWNYDGTQIPPEWHQWMHKMTDEIPTEKSFPKPFYTPKFQENLTGTSGAFKTYSTTGHKLEAWTPGVKERLG